MAHIVIDARQSGTSTGRYVDKLIEYLYQLKTGHSFTILAKTNRLDYMRKVAPKFKIVECPYKEFTFAEQTKLLKQIKGLNPDLVHFPIVQQPVLYRGKVVTTMNDLTTIRFRNPSKNWLIFTIKRWVYIWVNKVVARKSNALITYTEFVKDDVAKYTHTNSRKYTVIYLGADEVEAKVEPLKDLDGKKFIMYVGRPLPHKNLDRLIDAFGQIQKNQPDLHLVLAGKKDELYRRIAKRVKQESFENVVFTDFISDGQLRWLYENTSAYVFPSLSEGFGLPGLEAMIAGAPVVSSNATCLPEVYKDGAQYFDPLDIDDMAKAITKVLNNELLRKELIKKGKVVASKYSWQKTAQQTLEVYNQVLD
jgi:glycosyltransferase involved in cell wall biosynthesis